MNESLGADEVEEGPPSYHDDEGQVARHAKNKQLVGRQADKNRVISERPSAGFHRQ